MYKSLYFKPKYTNSKYDKWVSEFINEFGLNIIKQENNSYHVENDDMLIKIDKDFVTVLIFEQNNIELIWKLKNYFYKNTKVL